MRPLRHFLLLALQLVPPVAATTELKIALMIPMTPMTYEVEAWAHFKIAMKDVNNGTTLPGFGPGGYMLKWVLAPPGTSEMQALDVTARLLDEGVVGIVGPSFPFWVRSMAALCSLRKTIIMTPESDSIQEANKAPFPYLFRTGPTQMQSLWALAVLCKEMYWWQVGVLSSDEMSSSSTARILVPALDALELSYSLRVFVATQGVLQRQSTARKELVYMTMGDGYRIVIFNALKKDTFDVVRPFYDYKHFLDAMLMTTDFFQGTWWLVHYPNPIEVYDKDMISRYELHFPNPVLDWHEKRWRTDTTCFDPTNENHTAWDPVTGSPYFTDDDEIWDADRDNLLRVCNKWPAPKAWFVYDSVLALARAMSEVIQAGGLPTNGTAIREALFDVDFVGTTNRVFFDKTTQDRTAKVPIFTTGYHIGAPLWSAFIAKTTERFTTGGTPRDVGWCSSGCLSRGLSDVVYPKITWTWQETPRDGRKFQFGYLGGMKVVGRSAFLTTAKVYKEGHPVGVYIVPRDGFSNAPCARECGGIVVVPTASCTRCYTEFCDYHNLKVWIQSNNSWINPVVPWTISGNLQWIQLTAPRGIEGAGLEDRTVTVMLTYFQYTLLTQEIRLTSVVCKEGRFALNGMCFACLRGTISTTRAAANCTRCAPGTVQAMSGRTTCVNCFAGKYTPDEGSFECRDCPLGRWEPLEGQTVCRPCPHPMITVETGSVNITSCICPVNTYRPAYATFEPHMTTFPCLPCPTGMKCERGSDERAFGMQLRRRLSSSAGVFPKTFTAPKLLPSFWSEKSEPLNTYTCLSGPVQCPGGLPGTCGSKLEGKVCGYCSKGFYRDRGLCYECPSQDLSRLLFPTIPVFGSVLFVLFLYFTSRDKEGSISWNLDVRGTTHTLAICLAYFQTAGLVLKTNINLPNDGESSKIWSLMNKPMGLVQLECIGIYTVQGRMAVNMVIPIYAALVFLFVMFGSSLISRLRPGAKMDRKVIGSCFGSALLAFYISICSLSMDLFKCYEHPNGLTSVSSAPHIICGSEQWTTPMAFGIVCTVVYCGGSAAVFLWALSVAPSRAKSEDFKTSWKFLLARFRVRGRWWVMAWLAKGFFLNLVQVVFLHGQDQLVVIQLILLMYTAFTLWSKPWRHPLVNKVDAAVHTILCLACAPLYWFAPVPQDGIYTVRSFIVEKVLQIVPPALLIIFLVSKKALAFFRKKNNKGKRATVTAEDICQYHGVLADFCALESQIASDVITALAPMDRERMKMVCAALNDVFPDVSRTSTMKGVKSLSDAPNQVDPELNNTSRENTDITAGSR